MGFILITRPKKESEFLAKQLERKGYQSFIEPLFEANLVQEKILLSEENIEKNIQAILMTSANAIGFLLQLNLPKNILILAIGKKTGKIIADAGYSNIICAQNSAQSMLELAQKILVPQRGLVLYLAGVIITMDLAEELNKKGFEARKIIAYATIAKKELSLELIAKIENNQIDMVMIYSQNSASILHKLIIKHNLLKNFESIRIICLSEKIANHCLSLGFGNIGNLNELI